MTRLVVHAGTHATDWPAVQRQLVSWREPLERAGVRLHPADDAGAWTAAAGDLADGGPPESVVEAAKAATRDGAKAFLVSSERLEDPLRDPAGVANLQSFAADVEMPLTVVVVVRDQLGYLNELYCERVTHLQMARDFPSFVADPQPEERFDYATAFSRLIDVPGIEMVAIPYLTLVDRAQARSILTATGLAADKARSLPLGYPRDPLPGPVLIAATRLLFKRMWRMGMVKNLPRARLLEASSELAQHSIDQGWDDGPFWGWSERSRHETIERFIPGNNAFARAVWGHEWSGEWETGTFTDVDFAASAPALVVDMMLTVDRLIKELQKAKAKAAVAVTPSTD